MLYCSCTCCAVWWCWRVQGTPGGGTHPLHGQQQAVPLLLLPQMARQLLLLLLNAARAGGEARPKGVGQQQLRLLRRQQRAQLVPGCLAVWWVGTQAARAVEGEEQP